MMRWATVLALVAVACTTTPIDESAETSGATSTDPDPTEAQDSQTSMAQGSTGPEGTGAVGSTSSPATTDDGGTTDPGVYFDLGAIPDMPEGKDCQQAVDIVFVMDVSTTMAGFINILSNEILAVDAALQALELPQPPHYGLAVFVDDALLVNGGVPYLDATTLQADFDMWAAFTASNQQVGGGGFNSTWTENSLDALFFAADDFQWRPADSTIRIVIHTTDDTFWDGPTIGNGIMIQHGYGETVQALQNDEVRVYSFTDDIGGACNCIDVTPGWSAPYMGMVAVPEATDGLVYDIGQVLGGMVSLTDAINSAVEESFCDPYTPQG